MKPTLEKLEQLLEENRIELLKLDEIEKGYHENPDLDMEKRIRLLLTVENTRESRLRFQKKLLDQIASYHEDEAK